MNDFEDIMTGAKPRSSRPKTYEPFEAAVRTVIAEEADPVAQEWVAGVIANRLKSGKHGKDLYEVVTAEGQFEPWKRGTAQAVDVNSDVYKKTAERVRDILEGKRDPSGGAMNFYAPEAQAQLAKKDGRSPKAEFDDGTGVRVGQTLFFRPGGGGDDFGSVMASEPESAAGDWFKKTYGDISRFDVGAERAKLTAGKEPEPVPLSKANEAQRKFHLMQRTGGGYDPKEPTGAFKNPRYALDNQTIDEAYKASSPGDYFVDQSGVLHYLPTGEEENNSLARGVATGLENVIGSGMRAFPGAETSTLPNAMMLDVTRFNAEPQGPMALGGKIAGELIPTTAALAMSEGALAPTLSKTGLGRFLLGTAGQGAPMTAANLGVRGASLGTRGALEGSVAAGLTSGNDPNTPLGEQMLEGAIGGGIAGPLLPAAAGLGAGTYRGIRNFVEPVTAGGREKMVTRLLDKAAGGPSALDLTEYVPNVQPTLGEASGNAGLASLERVARTNPNLVQRFTERAEENATARSDFFRGLAKDPEAIAEARAARDAATAPVREAALANAQPADAAPVLAKIDEIVAGEGGKRKAVTTVLGRVRENLHNAKGDLETDARLLYGVRKDINDMLSNVATKDQGDARLATAELKAVKDALDVAIEKAAPNFRDYLKTYADMSKPIDEMQFLQGLNLTDTKGNITLAKLQGAITKIEKMRAAPGANEAKSLSDDTLTGLRNLRDDLKRAAQIDKGRARGSDTAQNAAMEGFAAEGGLPLSALGIVLGPKASILAQGAKFLGQSGRDEATQMLATRLLGPQYAPTPGQSPAIKGAARQLIERMGGAALPAAAGMLSNSLIGR